MKSAFRWLISQFQASCDHPLSVFFGYCLHAITNKWHRLIPVQYMHLVSSPSLHTQCHTCSANQVTFLALIQFNDWVFLTFPFTHCIQRRRTNGADLTSKHLWSQNGGMGHGSARGPKNSSPKVTPKHHTVMGRCNRTSTSVTGLYCVTVFHSLRHAKPSHNKFFPGQSHRGRGPMRATFLERWRALLVSKGGIWVWQTSGGARMAKLSNTQTNDFVHHSTTEPTSAGLIRVQGKLTCASTFCLFPARFHMLHQDAA